MTTISGRNGIATVGGKATVVAIAISNIDGAYRIAMGGPGVAIKRRRVSLTTNRAYRPGMAMSSNGGPRCCDSGAGITAMGRANVVATVNGKHTCVCTGRSNAGMHVAMAIGRGWGCEGRGGVVIYVASGLQVVAGKAVDREC